MVVPSPSDAFAPLGPPPLADLSKDAKVLLRDFHRANEPDARTRWLRQGVWAWRRMDPGMMTRNLVVLYVLLMAEFHYKESQRERELASQAAAVARERAAHRETESRVRALCRSVEEVLTRGGLYSDPAWNPVRRDYGRFAYEISRELASTSGSGPGATAAPGQGGRASPGTYGRFRVLNPYWWMGRESPPGWYQRAGDKVTGTAGLVWGVVAGGRAAGAAGAGGGRSRAGAAGGGGEEGAAPRGAGGGAGARGEGPERLRRRMMV